MQKHVHHFDWIRPEFVGGGYPQGFPSSSAILATVGNDKQADQQFGFWDPDVDLVQASAAVVPCRRW